MGSVLDLTFDTKRGVGLTWVEVEDYPMYLINPNGDIYNREYDFLMSTSDNGHGTKKVILRNEFGRRTKSVALLVAQAFLIKPNPESTSVIRLDGDLSNCHADNLAWRSPSFAWKYARQLEEPLPQYSSLSVTDIDTNEVYVSIFRAAIENGLLMKDIWKSTFDQSPVYPTWQRFSISRTEWGSIGTYR